MCTFSYDMGQGGGHWLHLNPKKAICLFVRVFLLLKTSQWGREGGEWVQGISPCAPFSAHGTLMALIIEAIKINFQLSNFLNLLFLLHFLGGIVISLIFLPRYCSLSSITFAWKRN